MSENLSGLESKIADFLCSLFVNGGIEPVMLNRDTDLVQLGLIDSFNIIEIATFLEREFAMQIDSESLRMENFKSITSIARMVGRRRAEAKG